MQGWRPSVVPAKEQVLLQVLLRKLWEQEGRLALSVGLLLLLVALSQVVLGPELPPTQTKPSDANPTAAPAESSPQPSPPSGLDRQARNLADFFNGQVLDVDDVN